MTLIETERRRDERRPDARFDAIHSVLWLGDAPVPMRVGERSNVELLTVIADVLRDLRNLEPDAPCHFRERELATFAELLDLDSRSLRSDLRNVLALSKSEAGALVGRLKEVRRSSMT